jgi:hypothetical protein
MGLILGEEQLGPAKATLDDPAEQASTTDLVPCPLTFTRLGWCCGSSPRVRSSDSPPGWWGAGHGWPTDPSAIATVMVAAAGVTPGRANTGEVSASSTVHNHLRQRDAAVGGGCAARGSGGDDGGREEAAVPGCSALTDGGRTITDLAALRDQSQVFGPVARHRRRGGSSPVLATRDWPRCRRPAPPPGAGLGLGRRDRPSPTRDIRRRAADPGTDHRAGRQRSDLPIRRKRTTPDVQTPFRIPPAAGVASRHCRSPRQPTTPILPERYGYPPADGSA